MPAISGSVGGRAYGDPNAARRRMLEEQQQQQSTMPAPTPLPAIPSGGGGSGPLPPPPMPPEPVPMPMSPSLQGLQMATGPEPAAAGDALMSGQSITDQNIGMRVPPSLAALLGKRAY